MPLHVSSVFNNFLGNNSVTKSEVMWCATPQSAEPTAPLKGSQGW